MCNIPINSDSAIGSNNHLLSNRSYNRYKGDLVEESVCAYLISQGYSICARNFRKPYGEIDIIASKDNRIHFFEVKSKFVHKDESESGPVLASFKPEENVHSGKLRKLKKTIRVYLLENFSTEEIDFTFNVASVSMAQCGCVMRIEIIKDIII